MNIGKVMLLITLMAGIGMGVSAQSYYDDDIYYDSSKEKKSTVVKKNSSASSYNNGSNYSSYVYDYPAADSYNFVSTSQRDVDEYNRRGNYISTDTLATDTLASDDFAYTRRIERFHNPTIVSGSSDAQLQEYYYSAQQPSEVNIYINSPYWNSWYPGSW